MTHLPSSSSSILLPHQADSHDLRNCLQQINANGWEQVMICAASAPTKPLKMCARNKLIITITSLDADFDLLLTEW